MLGQHDFRAFTPTETQHTLFTRTVERAEWARAATTSCSRSPPEATCATWCGRSSARCSSSSPPRSRSCLQGRPRSEAGPTAPPSGLYLVVRCLLTGCLRWILCDSRSSSSISTARSSTPARSSSPRCAMRRARCSGREHSDEELMHAVGGPGPRGADRSLRPRPGRRARARLPRAQRAAARGRSRPASAWRTSSCACTTERPPARRRDREAPLHGRARVRARAASRHLFETVVGGDETEQHKPDPGAVAARRRAHGRRSGDGRLCRRLAVRHAGREGGRDVRRRRHVGAHPRSRAPRGARSRTRSSTPRRNSLSSSERRARRAARAPERGVDRVPRRRRPGHGRRRVRRALRRAEGARGGGPLARHVRLADAARRRAALRQVPEGRATCCRWARSRRSRPTRRCRSGRTTCASVSATDEPVAYVVEPKIDGSAINLTYENGASRAALTRGDGVQGEDVTPNLRTIKTIPLQMQGTMTHRPSLEVRGEVYMPLDGFRAANEALAAEEKATWRRTRATPPPVRSGRRTRRSRRRARSRSGCTARAAARASTS